jgi:Histone methylation protein DOT1
MLMNKVQKSIAINGMTGTIKLAFDVLKRYLMWFLPSKIRERKEFVQQDLSFDTQWGVDTSGIMLPGQGDVVGGNWKYGTRYQGCDPSVFSEVINSLSINYPDYTFIDFGSGKGRAVLLAARFPFREVIGVEFAENLSRISQQNIIVFPKAEIQAGHVEAICADASQYDLPPEQLLIFLNNPFGKQVMEKVIENVVKSYQSNPRKMVIVYMTSRMPELWRKVSFLTEIRSDWISIYETNLPV